MEQQGFTLIELMIVVIEGLRSSTFLNGPASAGYAADCLLVMFEPVPLALQVGDAGITR